MRASKDLRVFFALWPDTLLRRSLQQAAQRVAVTSPARRVAQSNLHLTLHFIGNIDRCELECLQQQARAVQAAGFELRLDEVGYFARPKVAWLGCGRVPPALIELHRQLGQRLRQCGYQPENRVYSPHVTLVRKLSRAPRPIALEPLTWRVDNFVLVESRNRGNGVEYAVTETYSLS